MDLEGLVIVCEDEDLLQDPSHRQFIGFTEYSGLIDFIIVPIRSLATTNMATTDGKITELSYFGSAKGGSGSIYSVWVKLSMEEKVIKIQRASRKPPRNNPKGMRELEIITNNNLESIHKNRSMIKI